MHPALIILLVFLAWVWMAAFSSKRWLGYQWCMLIAAIVIALVCGVDPSKAVTDILTQGTFTYYKEILTYAVACMFARACIEAGIIESIIKKTIELGGGRPFLTVALITAVWSFINPNVPGVAGVIVVGSITLPVMMAMGINPVTAARIHMIGLVIGWPFWTVYWSSYQKILLNSIYPGDYIPLLLAMSIVGAIFGYTWIVYEFRKEKIPLRWAVPNDEGEGIESKPRGGSTFIVPEVAPRKKMAPWYSYIVIGLPIVLLVLTKVDMLMVFLAMLPLAFILSHPGSGRKLRDYYLLLERAAYEGFKDSAPIAINLIAVGWLLQTSKFTEVANAWKESFGAVFPAGFSWVTIALLILMFFAVLYRGPSYAFGIGAITYAALVTVGVPPIVLLAFLYATMHLMKFCDPTFAYAVWAYSFVGEHPIKAFNKEAFIWGLVMSIASFLVVIIMYLPAL